MSISLFDNRGHASGRGTPFFQCASARRGRAATRVALEMMPGEIDRTAPEAGNFGLSPVV
jgi:hypothetical protein